MAARFVIRLLPRQTEPLLAGLLRLAEVNRYPNIRTLLRIAAVSSTYATEVCDLSRLAGMCDCDPSLFEQTALWSGCTRHGTFRIGSSEVARRFVTVSKSRFCCQCLKDGYDYQDIWDLFGYICCPLHKCFLTERCMACGKLADWGRPGIARCQCGASFCTPAAEPTYLLIQIADAVKRLRDGQQLDEGMLPAANLEAGLSFLKFFSSWETRNTSWRGFYMSKPGIAGSAAAIQEGAEAFFDWPHGLRQWLGRRRAENPEEASASAAFGTLFHRLRSAMPTDGAEDVLEQIRVYMMMSVESPFIKTWSFIYPRTNLEAGYIRLDEAARELGLVRSMVRSLVDQKILDGECRISNGRRYWTLSRASVRHLLGRFGPFHNLKSASRRLRLPVPVLKFLLCKKVILPFGENSSRIVLSERDLKEFLKTLDHKTVRRTRHALPMATLFSRHSPQPCNTMAKIISGDIPIYRNSHRTEPQSVLDFSFGAASLGSNCETLDIHAAARNLGVNPRMVTVLTRRGLISTSQSASVRSRGRIPEASVDAFRRRYVLGREVARSLRSSSRHAIARLKVAGFRPVIEPDSQRGISSVWQRSDIEKLASSG